MLTNVTLTGADDNTDIEQLFDLSREFQFVEWGILIGKEKPCPRYPSNDWMHKLKDRFSKTPHANFAVHICSGELDKMLNNSAYPGCFEKMGPELFSRAQLNIHSWPISIDECYNVIKAIRKMDNPLTEFICQVANYNNWVSNWMSKCGINATSVYDMSGGKGVLPLEWPVPDPAWKKVGYAGGLGPENIVEQLEKIKIAAGKIDFWVDMESSLRKVDKNGDRFDLEKCRQVLQLMASKLVP